MFKFIIFAIVMIVIILFMILLVPYSLGSLTEQKKSAWNYLSNTKHKKWDDMTKEEQEKLVLAIQITDADCGRIRDKETIIKFLKETRSTTSNKIDTEESHKDKDF